MDGRRPIYDDKNHNQKENNDSDCLHLKELITKLFKRSFIVLLWFKFLLLTKIIGINLHTLNLRDDIRDIDLLIKFFCFDKICFYN